MQVTEGNFRPVKIAIRLFGREVLAVSAGRDDQEATAAPPYEEAPAEEEDPHDHTRPCGQPEPRTFGFHGGSGGTTELAWLPDADRPIDIRGDTSDNRPAATHRPPRPRQQPAHRL